MSMSVEENKVLIRRFTEAVYNHRELSVIDQLVASDFIYHHASGRDLTKKAYIKNMIASLNTFSEIPMEMKDLFAEGDKVACLFTLNCTPISDFQDIPSRGKKIKRQIIEIFRITNGKIAEIWSKYHPLGMMQQLDITLPLGKR